MSLVPVSQPSANVLPNPIPTEAPAPAVTGSRPPRTRSPRRLAVAGVLSALALVALVGCGGSSNDGTPAARQSQPAAVTSVTPGSHLGHGTSDAAGECASRMPGDVLTAAEAVVRFSAQRVCLGYVTVAPGTEVSWQNAGDQPGTVTVTTPTPVTSPAVAPGDTWTHRFDDRGVFSYRIDVLPAFVGTVEVVSP